MPHYAALSTQTIIARAALERAANPSRSIERLILNLALGAGFCFAGDDLLVESLSNPGTVYTVAASACNCRATRPCWHLRLFSLISDPPFEPSPLGSDEGDEVPEYSIGARIAIARRALMTGAI